MDLLEGLKEVEAVVEPEAVVAQIPLEEEHQVLLLQVQLLIRKVVQVILDLQVRDLQIVEMEEVELEVKILLQQVEVLV